jgi:hypothetical protein
VLDAIVNEVMGLVFGFHWNCITFAIEDYAYFYTGNGMKINNRSFSRKGRVGVAVFASFYI